MPIRGFRILELDVSGGNAKGFEVRNLLSGCIGRDGSHLLFGDEDGFFALLLIFDVCCVWICRTVKLHH